MIHLGNSISGMATRPRASHFVINPGETIVDAMRRHRRETGHRGWLVLAADNNRPGSGLEARGAA